MELPADWYRLTEQDLPTLLAFCCENQAYFSYMQSTPELETLREQLTILPPNAHLEQKLFMGLWEEDTLVAIADLVKDWPKSGTVYIGWFMLANRLQHKGLGSRLERQIEGYLRAAGYHTMRLACVEENLPALSFWQRCGFHCTGQRVDQGKYVVLLMEKPI